MRKLVRVLEIALAKFEEVKAIEFKDVEYKILHINETKPFICTVMYWVGVDEGVEDSVIQVMDDQILLPHQGFRGAGFNDVHGVDTWATWKDGFCERKRYPKTSWKNHSKAKKSWGRHMGQKDTAIPAFTTK